MNKLSRDGMNVMSKKGRGCIGEEHKSLDR